MKKQVMIQKINHGQRGFTLLELIIVFGILAILSTMMIVILDPFTQYQKANDGRRKSDLFQIQRALEAYYQDVGRYPGTTGATGGNMYLLQVSNDSSDPIKEWGTAWIPYMNAVPKDPSGSRRYIYVSSSNGQTYWVYASLERGGKDPQACPEGEGDNKCPNVPEDANCGGTCNYGVSSPNESP